MRKSSESRVELGPYTWREFVDLHEDDPRELLDGRLVEIEVATWTHERIVAALIAILGNWAWIKKAGQVLGSGYKLRIDDRRGTMPDVQFYRRGNSAIGAGGQEAGLEQGRASLGIPDYWLLDPEARTLERLVLREGTYSILEALEGNAIFRPAGFEGLEIDLKRVWDEGAQ